MIHEATFEPDLMEEARVKRHSTTPEAVGIANQAQAQALILTHFSQRYPRAPVLTSAKVGIVQEPDMPTMIAFDTLRYSFADAKRLPEHVPLIQHLFDVLYPGDDEPGDDDAQSVTSG